MNENLKTAVFILLVLLLVATGTMFEIYRWQEFQEVTGSEVGYWKWKFLFDNWGSKR